MARKCFRLPRSELFGVRAVTLTLFFRCSRHKCGWMGGNNCTFLGKNRSIEDQGTVRSSRYGVRVRERGWKTIVIGDNPTAWGRFAIEQLLCSPERSGHAFQAAAAQRYPGIGVDGMRGQGGICFPVL